MVGIDRVSIVWIGWYGRIVYLTTSLYLYSIPTLPFPL